MKKDIESINTMETSAPKKRGRPRKNPEEVTATNTTPKKTKSKKNSTITPDLVNLDHLTVKDIRNNPILKEDVRNTVETYYDIQDVRIRSGNRKSAIQKMNKKAISEGNEVPPEESQALYLQYVENKFKDTEETITKFLKQYVEATPIGRWLMEIPGIGPVLAAGLLAYIDIEKCETAGAIWKYAGIEGPSQPRKKGVKLNYNPKFKVLCWKIGQSFIKVSGNKNDIYGQLYKAKKEYYTKKNEEGGFAEKAKEELSKKNFDPNTKSYQAYTVGKLPDSQIVNMAARFATKIFLSHLFELWYEYDRGTPAPNPFVQEHLGHVHIMKAPYREIVFGGERDNTARHNADLMADHIAKKE